MIANNLNIYLEIIKAIKELSLALNPQKYLLNYKEEDVKTYVESTNEKQWLYDYDLGIDKPKIEHILALLVKFTTAVNKLQTINPNDAILEEIHINWSWVILNFLTSYQENKGHEVFVFTIELAKLEDTLNDLIQNGADDASAINDN